jgi:hypothetical protein
MIIEPERGVVEGSVEWFLRAVPQRVLDAVNRRSGALGFLDMTAPVDAKGADGEFQELAVPVYAPSKVPAGFCSRYTRLAAQDLFGIPFASADAWNLRYHEEVVGDVNGKSLSELARDQVMVPGDQVTLHYPASSYNGRSDEQGNELRYSHTSMFLGLDESDEPLVAHKFVDRTRVDTPAELAELDLTPIEVIRAKNL